MRCLTGLLGCCLLTAVAPAQEPHIRVLANGASAGIGQRLLVARDASQGANLLQECSLPDGSIAVDYTKECLVAAWYGDGSGGHPVADWFAPVDPDAAGLLRITGDPKAPSTKGRWAVFAVPVSLLPRPDALCCETDTAPVGGDSAWRAVSPTALPFPLSSAGELRADPGAAAVWCTDAAALHHFWREHAHATPVPDIDFAEHLVVVVRGRPAGLCVLRSTAQNGVPPRMIVRSARDVTEPPATDAPSCRWFVLPKTEGAIEFEQTMSDRPDCARVVQRVDPCAMRGPTIAPLLRVFECELATRDTLLCERATTAAEWKDLRRAVGGSVKRLPDDWADFEHEAVVVLATEAARMWSGCDLRVEEEEGVDVITVLQRGPSGEDPGLRSLGVVVKVPRRKGQMSIVLRREVGPAPAGEQTLRVFEGF